MVWRSYLVASAGATVLSESRQSVLLLTQRERARRERARPRERGEGKRRRREREIRKGRSLAVSSVREGRERKARSPVSEES